MEIKLELRLNGSLITLSRSRIVASHTYTRTRARDYGFRFWRSTTPRRGKTCAITSMLETEKRASAAHRFSTSRLFSGLITGSLKFMPRSAIRSNSASPIILNAKSSAPRNTRRKSPSVSRDRTRTGGEVHRVSFFNNAAALYIPRAYIHPRDPQTDHLGIQFAERTIPRNSADNFDVPTSRADRLQPYFRIRLFLSIRSFLHR